MKNIYGFTYEELEQYFLQISDKTFRAVQVYDWLYKKRVSSFSDMVNIKKEIREQLEKDFTMKRLSILKKEEDTLVFKYLFELEDQNKIEAVLMQHDYGNSLCISTQVGCNMGCSFCESGRLKKRRNLETFEMVLQILMIEEDLHLKITHIVLMGIGEPFDNYANVLSFIDIVNCPKGIDIGSRHITISTSGIVPKIREFSNYSKQVNLAISLHAPNNEKRSKLMQVNRVYPIEEVIIAVKEYIEKTKRRVTFEYIMLKGVNDTKEDAFELAGLLKGINCYVNLIPYNETSHIEYQKSTPEQIVKFYDILKKNHIQVTIRKEFGSKVSAACGQLRSNYEEER